MRRLRLNGLPRLRDVRTVATFLCVWLCIIFLLVIPPMWSIELCPVVLSDKDVQSDITQTGADLKAVDCSLYHDPVGETTAEDSSHLWCGRHDDTTNRQYVNMASDCEQFVRMRGYLQHPVTDEEINFPLAFSILLHDNVEQFERLLRAIYRPHNVYCVHVDAKASRDVHAAVRAITSCLDNVSVASRTVSVHRCEYSVLDAEMACLHDLWAHPSWRYYINLAGTEFPLRTNHELVQILKVYNGSNEIDGSIYRRPVVWTKYSYRYEYWRTNKLKSPPPHGFLVAKGSTHVAASRAFIDYALHDTKALDLLEWLKDTRCPDEHYFPTLNNNPQRRVPGAYTGDPDTRDGFYVRLKLWSTPDTVCHGKYVNFICVLGARDIHHAIHAKHMFVNKLNLDMDPVAFQCLEQWYQDRVQRGSDPDFDIEFWKSRKLVQQLHT